MLIVMFDMKIT